MAPELYLGKPYKGEPVDVFAVGVTLFNLVAGFPAFNNANSNELNSPYRYMR